MPRVFFAIWPDAAAAEKLRALSLEVAEETGGRPTPPDNIHLTLEFLGEVAAERIDELGTIGGKVDARAFKLSLGQLGAFRRAGIAWLGSLQAPPELIDLQGRLNRALRAAGFALEDRPYSPHVTLARRTDKPPRKRAIEPVEWRVTEFALVRSEPGRAKYTTLAVFRLA